MQAHSAPLGITFYDWHEANLTDGCNATAAFPQSMDGFAFIAFHGSWNRDVPTGYKVVYVPIDGSDGSGKVAGEPIDLLTHEGSDAQWESGFRPVDLDFDDCGRLVVTSDGSRGDGATMIRIEYGKSTSSAVSYGPSMFVAWTIFIGWLSSRWL